MIWKICNQEVSYEILEVFLCFVIVVSPVLCVNMWSIKANDMAGIVRKCIKEAYDKIARQLPWHYRNKTNNNNQLKHHTQHWQWRICSWLVHRIWFEGNRNDKKKTAKISWSIFSELWVIIFLSSLSFLFNFSFSPLVILHLSVLIIFV